MCFKHFGIVLLHNTENVDSSEACVNRGTKIIPMDYISGLLYKKAIPLANQFSHIFAQNFRICGE